MTRISAKGLTLIESIVTVVIISTLLVLAFPSIKSFFIQGNRLAAQTDLLSLAIELEHFRDLETGYKFAAENGASTGKPTVFTPYSPSQGSYESRFYDLTIIKVSETGRSYTIKATPIADSVQTNDGALYMFSDGRKGWDMDNNGKLDDGEYCWDCDKN